MTEKLNIVQSTTEPNKRNIWLKDNELKKFGAKGWSTIGGSNTGGGGGTSTDKDFLTMLVGYDTKTVTVNDKQFPISNINNTVILINNEYLYNYLSNIDMPVFIKLISKNSKIAGYVFYIKEESTSIVLSFFFNNQEWAIIISGQ